MKRMLCIILCAVFAFAMTACDADLSQDNTSVTSGESKISAENTNSNSGTSNTDSGSYDLSFSNRDCDTSYDESTACKVVFSETSASVSSGNGATVNQSVVTINSEGTYIFSGECSDGQILVKAADDEKVQIVLNGLEIASSSSPLIIESADKVFITLAESTENTLSDASSYELTVDDSTVDGTIFSKSDLTINGEGTLNVNGNYKHAIVSKDDLILTGGKLNVVSKTAAIDGKDCVKIREADITVDSEGDGIRSTNTEETDIRGFIYIESGNFKIDCANDAFQACSLLQIDAGSFDITTGGGSENGATHSDFGGGMDMFSNNSDIEDSESAKAIKSADIIKINGGLFSINSSDDALHSNNTVSITDGTFDIKTGDDGIHANSTLTIDGGTIVISQSYEGIEAGDITINGGNISVVSSDDGFNAAGGSDEEQEPGAFSSHSSKSLTINGGYILVDASGDGLDSNGTIAINGGVTLVSGPVNGGNGAIDYETSAVITGGVLIALGSSDMAESVTGDGQCSIMTDITSQNASVSFALCDSSGNVVASFTPAKSYSNVVVSTPDIQSGETYTIKCGGNADKADSNGYCTEGSLSGGTEITSIEMTSENYSSGSGMNGGMGGQMERGGGMDRGFR